MKKYYNLKAVSNGESRSFSNRFPTREAAINFIFDYYENNYQYGMQLEDEYEHGSKHNIEYVFDYNNRFYINRVCA